MNKPSSIEYPGIVHYLYYNNRNILLDNKDRQNFVKILKKHPSKINLILGMYTIRGTYL